MSHLLITGSSGLLGANLVLELETPFEVTAVMHTQRMRFARATVVQADLTQASSVRELFEDYRPDWIIHCAADTTIDDLELDSDRATHLNIHMARVVAKAAASIQSQLLFVSTDSVFDGRGGPYRERDRPKPLNIYARSKLEGERAVLEEHPGVLIVRTNLFGWSLTQKKSLAEWFFSKLIGGERCRGFPDIYFSPIYAPDLASIFVQMLDQGLDGLYHVPGDECLSKFEFGRRLAKAFGFDPELIFSAPSDDIHWKAQRPKRTCLDGSKIIKTLGISLPSLETGLNSFRADHESGLPERLQTASKLEELDA